MTASTSITAGYPGTTSSGSQDLLALAGRALLALLFIPAGIGKLTGFAATVGYIASAGLPLPTVGAVIAIVVEIGVAAAFLAGFKTRASAWVLAVFTLVAAITFHNYWAMPADKAYVNQLMFFKDLAIVGGFLAFAAFGAGRFSVDRR